MGTFFRDALLVQLDPARVEAGNLRVADGKIVAVGPGVVASPGDEIVDCGGAVLMPGLVNGHTHLYSALAAGMPVPPHPPRNFHEILKFIWWRLDRAHDLASVETSGVIGALAAVHCGTTTLIDHHASPNAIDGSLDQIERGIDSVGLRGVLCYEVTDRNGREGRDAGIAENRRYLSKCATRQDGRFAGLVGAHASFTLEDVSLEVLAQLAEEFQVGVHIHVAEDPCDAAACRRDHQIELIDRLDRHWLLKRDSIFAHGTHLTDDAIARINETGLTIAHNTRSNMNNAVGYAPLNKLKCPIMLGTDGIGGDMFAEMRTAWFKSRDARNGLSPMDIIVMLANSARRASQSLGVTLGKLEVGAAADVVVTDYVPFAPLDSANLVGHMLFAMDARHVRDVMIDGSWAMRDRRVTKVDEAETRGDSVRVSKELWKRFGGIS